MRVGRKKPNKNGLEEQNIFQGDIGLVYGDYFKLKMEEILNV
jgi:hypothetical protein